MLISINSGAVVSRPKKRPKIICTTCNLKGCVGRCSWKSVSPCPVKRTA